MTDKEETSNLIIKPSKNDEQFAIELKKSPIVWDLENSRLSFFGIDSALFWTDPSLVRMLLPLAQEIGTDFFRLLVAYSSSLGTQKDYNEMVSVLGNSFEEGFLAWGKAVSTAGWGVFEMPEFDPDKLHATVIIKNSWEIRMQRNLSMEKRWGAPFLLGKIIGIFSHAFKTQCWADDVCHYDLVRPYVALKIFPSQKTIESEIKELRRKRMAQNEKKLAQTIEIRTTELHQARQKIEGYTKELEQKVSQKAEQLITANAILKKKIIERDQALESSQKSESKLKAVLDQSFGFVGLISLDGRVIEANQTALSFVGLSFDEVYNKRFWETPWWNHSSKLVKKLESSIQRAARGEIVRFEAAHKSTSGKIHIIDFSLKPIKNNDGGVFMLLAEGRDISKLKKAGEDLAKSNHYLDKIINSIADPIFVKDSQHRFVLVNDPFCILAGHQRQEILGKTDYDFFPQKQADKLYAKEKNVLTKGKEQVGEEQIINYQGKIRTHFSKITRYIDEQGNAFIVGIIQDITEKKIMEARFHHAAKMESIGTLAAGIAHDFNNILSGIFGYSQLAKNDIGNPEKAKADIQKIIIGATRASELVQQILTFCRKTDYQKRVLNLYVIIKEVTKLIRSVIPAKIEIKTVINSKAAIMADPAKMHQMVMNLCTNAFQAMEDTGGELLVKLNEISVPEKAEEDAEYKKFIELEIKDTGHGMDKNTLARIFEPYFTTKTRGKGTGLGLALVHAIVEEHHGTIDITSAIEEGSSFIVRLPITERNSKLDPDSFEKLKIPNGTESILFVDDEESIRSFMKALLEKQGFNLTMAENGVAAYQEFKKNPNKFDMIITDIAMPKMNGDELAAKALELRNDIPIIICTGYSNKINETSAKELGISKLVQKPIAGEEMCLIIREILDKK